MFGDGALAFREFVMQEPLPLAAVHDAVLEFMCNRDDVVLFGAQAVNAYVRPSRMTEDVDIACVRAVELADELRKFLNKRLHISARVREIRDGLGYRVYQVRKPENRHLVDIRPVDALPPAQQVKKILVVTPPELVANKVMSMIGRRHKPKGLIDQADPYRLLLAFPDLKTENGEVANRLRANGADKTVLDAWQELVSQEILAEDEDDKFER
jgi:hypothetical protein